MADASNRFKKLVYHYDLVSGKVNEVAYQPGQKFVGAAVETAAGMVFYNKFMTDRFFSTLGLDMNCKKVKRLYYKCLNKAELAA